MKRTPACHFVLIVISAAAAASAQTTASARAILKAERALTSSEVATVLAEVRRAVAGKAFRLGYAVGGPGVEIRMGPNGRPQYIRTGSEQVTPQGDRIEVVTVTEYTETPARSCSGAALEGNLVLEFEYFNLDKRWAATARTRRWTELGAPLFDMLTGDMAVEAGGRRQIGDRSARALVAPYKHPPSPPNVQIVDPLPEGTLQSLWIDVESLLPLRWVLALSPNLPAGAPEYGLWFNYDDTLELQRPAGVAVPECIV